MENFVILTGVDLLTLLSSCVLERVSLGVGEGKFRENRVLLMGARLLGGTGGGPTAAGSLPLGGGGGGRTGTGLYGRCWSAVSASLGCCGSVGIVSPDEAFSFESYP